MIVTVKPRRTAILGVLPKNKPINGEMTVDLNPREINYCLGLADVFDEQGNPISEKIPEDYHLGSDTIVKNGYKPSSVVNAFPVKIVNEPESVDEDGSLPEELQDEIGIRYKSHIYGDMIPEETEKSSIPMAEFTGDSDLITIAELSRNNDGSYTATVKLSDRVADDKYGKDAFIIAINKSKVKPVWEIYKESEDKFVKFASKIDDIVLGEEKSWKLKLIPKTEDHSIDIDFIIKLTGSKEVVNTTEIKFTNLN